MFKVNNKDTRMTSTMCSVSIVNFESFVPCDFSTSTCLQFLLQKIGKNL